MSTCNPQSGDFGIPESPRFRCSPPQLASAEYPVEGVAIRLPVPDHELGVPNLPNIRSREVRTRVGGGCVSRVTAGKPEVRDEILGWLYG